MLGKITIKIAYELDIHYIDVGQGDCTLIVIRDEAIMQDDTTDFDQSIVRTVLIDCGSTSSSSAFTVSPEDSLINKIIEVRIERLDVVIMTHYDEDHFSGIVKLLDLAVHGASEIRQLFQGTKFYDQGIVYRKNFDYRGFNDCNRSGKILPGFALINSYSDLLDELSSDHYNLGIQRMTSRVFTGYPNDYTNGEWDHFHRAAWDTSWETGKFQNHLKQGILIQDIFWTPTVFENGFYDEVVIDNINYYNVQTLPCHHCIGIDVLNHGFQQQLIGVELLCVAANGYVAEFRESGNFVPQLAYSNRGDWNKFSMGFILCQNQFTHWFGGDLESDQEDLCVKFIDIITQDRRLTAMKASHHGSNASTSSYFLESLRPELVIISCGNWLQHHHPHEEVIERLIDVTPTPIVIMTNAPEYDGLKQGTVPSFYNPGGIDTQFYISGSSLEEVIGNISVHISAANRSITYWEQNHQFEINSDYFNPVFQSGDIISVAEFITFLQDHYAYRFSVYDHPNGNRDHVLLDVNRDEIVGYFLDDLLLLNGITFPIGRIIGNSYHFPF